MTLIRGPISSRWRGFTMAAGLALAACAPTPPASQPGSPTTELLPLPEFSACAPTTHPTLPAKWQTSALLQDFFQDALWFGNFVYDEDAGAFRFQLANRYGAILDYLVTTGGTLYALAGDGELPSSCAFLTDKSPYTVPPRDLLQAGAECVGQAPILARNQQWWKSPSGVGANWYWFDTTTRLPFRSMFYQEVAKTSAAPIYEYFTFDYFPDFREVPATNLAQILAQCRSSQASSQAEASTEYSQLSLAPILAKSGYPKVDNATVALAQQWIPGLSECSSTGDLPPSWPDQVQATVFMTAVSFKPNPFPTRVFYDWTQQAQNSTLYVYPPNDEELAQVALLLENTGFGIGLRPDGSVASCEQSLPGPQIPDWNAVDGCQCRAQIAPGTVLNPSDVPTKILWCPTDLSAKQVFWTWYSNTGTPVVFMQSNSSPTAGTGLNLADYYHWSPHSVAPEGTFDLPAACQGTEPIQVPQACHNCHLPLN